MTQSPWILKISVLEAEENNSLATENRPTYYAGTSPHPFRDEDAVIELVEVFLRLRNNSAARGKVLSPSPLCGIRTGTIVQGISGLSQNGLHTRKVE
jgi:hypothetical protein